MLELAMRLRERLEAGRRVAVVTVTGVARSAPRGVGSSMAVTDSGEVIGSISGGCVEGDAVVLAHAVLAAGAAATARFGFDDATAHAAGLACGGQIDVIAYEVRADDPAVAAALTAASEDRAVTVGLALDGPDAGRLIDPSVADAAIAAGLDAAALLADTRVVRADGEASGAASAVLALSHAPRPRLILLGAGDHAAALCRVASAAGFAVTVCDVWPTLVTPARFPEAAELVADDPAAYLAAQGPRVDARTAVCVLTHDTRIDVPAIRTALGLPVGFVGALGARSTVARRAELLRAADVSNADLARLHSPLGLDLGGAAPDEVAIAVLAEIVQTRHGAGGRPLRDGAGPLHRPLARADEPAHADPATAGSCAVPAPIPAAGA
jgi:xanthine dehydrogenase accessory factor